MNDKQKIVDELALVEASIRAANSSLYQAGVHDRHAGDGLREWIIDIREDLQLLLDRLAEIRAFADDDLKASTLASALLES